MAGQPVAYTASPRWVSPPLTWPPGYHMMIAGGKGNPAVGTHPLTPPADPLGWGRLIPDRGPGEHQRVDCIKALHLPLH